MGSHKQFHYRWEWYLQSGPELLWPLVADTNRFNKDTGLPPLDRKGGKEEPLRNARRRLRFFKLGVKVEWEEEPFEWVEPYRFGVIRYYRSGPVKRMRVLAKLARQPAGGTRLVYQVWAWPANVLGLVAIPLQIGLLSARSFATVFRHYDRAAPAPVESLEQKKGPVQFAAGGKQRLVALRQALLQEGVAADLLERLLAIVEGADELTVSRLRPYSLADGWGVGRRALLELCLLATRLGLLEFEWDLLCPLCRGAKVRSPSLGGIGPQVHCDTCKIDFNVNFERSVELTFHPNPSVRTSLNSDFCVAGPRVTPHVVVQQLLDSGERRRVRPLLELGRYRVRTLECSGGQSILVAERGAQECSVLLHKGDWPAEEGSLAPDGLLCFENATDAEQLFILERLAWSDQAATAAEVTALQCFRDLFSAEALRPGERISVGSLTILFTDLCGSTRLYKEVGDAPAFGLVMNHFDLLLEAIAAEEGAVVKTIGDVVMAVFRRPVGAVRAIHRVQQALATAPGKLGDLQLKAGMHYGPCIAVTLNDKLDYFGSTVNIASRLEHLSEGGDIVMSTAVHDDPEVLEMLEAEVRGFGIEPVEATLKGFEEEHFELRRLKIVQ